MQSSRVKHLWLIHPQEPPPPALPLDAASGCTLRHSPAWDLLCLHAFFHNRTGHTADIIDLRLYDHIEDALNPSDAARSPSLAVIYAATPHLGSLGEIARLLHNGCFPVPVVVFGPHITAFPKTLNFLPEIDFACVGDPEIPLRHLIDSIDVPRRLHAIPGLVPQGCDPKPPYWMADLKSLSLPDWDCIDWNPYAVGTAPLRGARIEARFTRGNTGKTGDEAWPSAPHEPLRTWPMKPMAQLLQKCSGHGIIEVCFTDPPGFWTDELLLEWCDHLQQFRNTQPWAFQLVARDLPDEVILALGENGCRRIELIIPAARPEHRERFGMTVADHRLKDRLSMLKERMILPQLVYWIEGPQSEPSEAKLIMQHLKQMDRPAFAVYPFPCLPETSLYRQAGSTGQAPWPLGDWIAWAQAPERHPPPVDLWTGAGGASRARHTVNVLHASVTRNSWRWFFRSRFDPGGTAKWFRNIEDKAAALFRRRN